MKIISVVGARPNFIKIAPFYRAIELYNKNTKEEKIENILVHTGQHYDYRMSENFFTSLGIPEPDINLEVGSGSHAYQVGQTMISFEKVLLQYKPDWVVVVGDVNATLACSITAKKQYVKCCHIEAGLRSGDMSMPEEINRLVTDRLSDLLLTPDSISTQNLINEGIAQDRIRFVGNIMIDTLETNRNKASTLRISDTISSNLLFQSKVSSPFNQDAFAVVTIHRPSNVDSKNSLHNLVSFICEEMVKNMQVVWPIHPRTYGKIQEFGFINLLEYTPNLYLLHPVGYLEMLALTMNSSLMLTDSGGLQEECCIFGTPCLTLRWNTERPITLQENGGVSVLVGDSISKIKHEFNKAMFFKRKPTRPLLWDGHTAERCLDAILTYLQ